MSHRFRNHITFGLVGIGGAFAIYLILATTTQWNWYFDWLIAASVMAFVFFGLDKGLSKTSATRIPEAILNLMSIVGGFLGSLLGMLVFRHKTSFRAHPLFVPTIVIGAILWGAIAYWYFWR